jgi:hypothetical protein
MSVAQLVVLVAVAPRELAAQVPPVLVQAQLPVVQAQLPVLAPLEQVVLVRQVLGPAVPVQRLLCQSC